MFKVNYLDIFFSEGKEYNHKDHLFLPLPLKSHSQNFDDHMHVRLMLMAN